MSEVTEAIAIWRENASILSLEDYNYSSCPLCREHKGCIDCPIVAETGETECFGTPFYDAQYAHNHADLNGFKKHATKMVALLERLQ